MSRSSRAVLAASALLSAATVVAVHVQQRRERESSCQPCHLLHHTSDLITLLLASLCCLPCPQRGCTVEFSEILSVKIRKRRIFAY
ncbi:protein PET117 homolog, mitochondrial isoform X1 [Mycteria americana]|uniref:protein PET117 homolog, mitochondrial isoform X1 n=1 Tax=Mycteria americana TaxID=33587 RepID=UPI003F581EBE